jgi:hypothetical protein
VTGCTTAALRWVSPAQSTRIRREFFAKALAETKSFL